MSSVRKDWSLPSRFLFLPILFIAVSLVPAALWVGAITPILTTTVLQSSISTSFYQPDPTSTFWNNSWTPVRANVNYEDTGSFSYSPAIANLGLILKNAAAAISTNSEIIQHSKNDLTQYFYEGRSLGVGTSPGLVDPPWIESSFNPRLRSKLAREAPPLRTSESPPNKRRRTLPDVPSEPDTLDSPERGRRACTPLSDRDESSFDGDLPGSLGIPGSPEHSRRPRTPLSNGDGFSFYKDEIFPNFDTDSLSNASVSDFVPFPPQLQP